MKLEAARARINTEIVRQLRILQADIEDQFRAAREHTNRSVGQHLRQMRRSQWRR